MATRKSLAAAIILVWISISHHLPWAGAQSGCSEDPRWFYYQDGCYAFYEDPEGTGRQPSRHEVISYCSYHQSGPVQYLPTVSGGGILDTIKYMPVYREILGYRTGIAGYKWEWKGDTIFDPAIGYHRATMCGTFSTAQKTDKKCVSGYFCKKHRGTGGSQPQPALVPPSEVLQPQTTRAPVRWPAPPPIREHPIRTTTTTTTTRRPVVVDVRPEEFQTSFPRLTPPPSFAVPPPQPGESPPVLSGQEGGAQTAGCGAPRKLRRRQGEPFILGGYKVEITEFPWQAALVHDQVVYCGGALLNDRWILTAATCVSDQTLNKPLNADEFDICLGMPDTESCTKRLGGERIAVENVIVHKEYSPETMRADIALVKLSRPVSYSDAILPICLPDQNWHTSMRILLGENCMVSGYGLTKSEESAKQLWAKSVKVIQTSICRNLTRGKRSLRAHPEELLVRSKRKAEYDWSDSLFCAGSATGAGAAGPCLGDSGSPLVVNAGNEANPHWVVKGVVGWISNECDEAAAGFVRVHRFLPWIASVMHQS